MTPQQWLFGKLTTILASNNPGASADEVAQLAGELAGLWATLILPNLTADLTTGAIVFNVPADS